MKKRITTAQRRHQDYLRRKGLAVGQVYAASLGRSRLKLARTLLADCKDYNVDSWANVVRAEWKEDYLPKWFRGLYLNTGVPNAKSVARDLNRAKGEYDDVWEEEIDNYIQNRLGEKITLVTGTYKDSLIRTIQTVIDDNPGMGVEKLTQMITRQTKELLEWEVRRIAQTETMMALAEGGNIAAKTLGISYTKTWCTSGNTNVRDTHAEVDGVTVDEDDYFEVGGSLLMYPHDTSMGAAPGQIINCACSCIRMPK